MTFEQWMEKIHQLFSEKFLIIKVEDFPEWDWRVDYDEELTQEEAFQRFVKDN